jgi:hypothetical protein
MQKGAFTGMFVCIYTLEYALHVYVCMSVYITLAHAIKAPPEYIRAGSAFPEGRRERARARVKDERKGREGREKRAKARKQKRPHANTYESASCLNKTTCICGQLLRIHAHFRMVSALVFESDRALIEP